jgi:hypothetical protein
MDARTLVTLTIEVDVAVEPISGTLLIAGAQPAQAFCGWLELTSLIERARFGDGLPDQNSGVAPQ